MLYAAHGEPVRIKIESVEMDQLPFPDCLPPEEVEMVQAEFNAIGNEAEAQANKSQTEAYTDSVGKSLGRRYSHGLEKSVEAVRRESKVIRAQASKKYSASTRLIDGVELEIEVLRIHQIEPTQTMIETHAARQAHAKEQMTRDADAPRSRSGSVSLDSLVSAALAATRPSELLVGFDGADHDVDEEASIGGGHGIAWISEGLAESSGSIVEMKKIKIVNADPCAGWRQGDLVSFLTEATCDQAVFDGVHADRDDQSHMSTFGANSSDTAGDVDDPVPSNIGGKEVAMVAHKKITIEALSIDQIDVRGVRTPNLRPNPIEIRLAVARRFTDSAVVNVDVDLHLTSTFALLSASLPKSTLIRFRATRDYPNLPSDYYGKREQWLCECSSAAHAAAMWELLHKWATGSMNEDSGTVGERITSLFDSLDADHSGVLTYEQFGALLTQHAIHLNKATISTLLERVDQDKSGVISKSEFFAYFGQKAP